MKYSLPATALVSALVLLFFGCGGDGDGDGVTATEAPSAATATSAGAGPQELLEFAGGSGISTTREFKLNSGTTVFHVTHDGEGEFRAVLFNPLGNQVAILIGSTLMGGPASRAIGRIDEMVTAKLTTPGLHVIEVTADGDWTIEIEQ